MARANILVSLLTVGKSIQSLTIKYDISCYFFIDSLYQVGEVGFSLLFFIILPVLFILFKKNFFFLI